MTKLMSFGAFFKGNTPEGFEATFTRFELGDDRFDTLYTSIEDLTAQMLDDETMTVEEVRSQLAAFIPSYNMKVFGQSTQPLERKMKAVELRSDILQLILLIFANVNYLVRKNDLLNDDHNGMMYAYLGKPC